MRSVYAYIVTHNGRFSGYAWKPRTFSRVMRLIQPPIWECDAIGPNVHKAEGLIGADVGYQVRVKWAGSVEL